MRYNGPVDVMTGDTPSYPQQGGNAAPQPTMGRLEIGGELAALISDSEQAEYGNKTGGDGSATESIIDGFQRVITLPPSAKERTRQPLSHRVSEASMDELSSRIRPFFDDRVPDINRPLSAPPIQPDVRAWASGEAEVHNDDIRLDASYYDYYHSFKPLDHRLPKPLDVSYYQNLKATESFEVYNKMTAPAQEGRRPPNIRVEVDDNSPRPRTLVDQIQEDFPRTPSPVHRAQSIKGKAEVPLVKELLYVQKHQQLSAHSAQQQAMSDMVAIGEKMEALRVHSESSLNTLHDPRDVRLNDVPASARSDQQRPPLQRYESSASDSAPLDDRELAGLDFTTIGGGHTQSPSVTPYNQIFSQSQHQQNQQQLQQQQLQQQQQQQQQQRGPHGVSVDQHYSIPNVYTNNVFMPESTTPDMVTRAMSWNPAAANGNVASHPMQHTGGANGVGHGVPTVPGVPGVALHAQGGYQQVTHHIMGMNGVPSMVQQHHYGKPDASWSNDGPITVEPVVMEPHSLWGGVGPQVSPSLRNLGHSGMTTTRTTTTQQSGGGGVHHHHHIYHHMHPSSGARIPGMNGDVGGMPNGIPSLSQRHQLGYSLPMQLPGGMQDGKRGGKLGKSRVMNSFGRSNSLGGVDDLYGNDNGPTIRSKLLDEFRSGRNRVVRLEQIKGSVVEFAADQYGSRFIQQKLEAAADSVKESVFEELSDSALDLMKSVFGNYVIQKLFEYGLSSQKTKLVALMRGHVVDLSLHMYGCRVVQKAIEMVSGPVQREIVLELQDHVIECVKDQNGNHVIQKCIEHVPAGEIQFVLAAFRGKVDTVATHPYGCRVIQRILEHCSPEDMKAIVSELQNEISYLVYCQYGNYVVQHILERGGDDGRKVVIESMTGHVLDMSQHKFASNVVEKCIIHAPGSLRHTLIEEVLVGLGEDAAPAIVTMIKDQYANYVVQKMLDTCDPKQHTEMVDVIMPHVHLLKKFTYGKHILTKLAKESSELSGGHLHHPHHSALM